MQRQGHAAADRRQGLHGLDQLDRCPEWHCGGRRGQEERGEWDIPRSRYVRVTIVCYHASCADRCQWVFHRLWRCR